VEHASPNAVAADAAVPWAGLTDEDVERFVRDGAIRLAGAFPRDLADECRRLLWADTGCSHLDAARLLFSTAQPAGFCTVARELAIRTEHLPEVVATGDAGDVWLCHPFVVHAAQRHRGTRVRFMAQPPLAGTGPIDPAHPVTERSPVEEAVHRALDGSPGASLLR
jgi:hypothetical protein